MYDYVARNLDTEAAVRTAHDYTRPTRPANILGIIERVIVTDSDDFTIFEWRKDEGVTYPPECRGRI